MRNRTFSPFSPRPQQEPQAPPPQPPDLRQRLVRFFSRYQSFLLAGAAVIVTLTSVFVYDATRTPPQRLTQRDIDAAVTRSLESAPPKPSYESQVYQIIRPSLVLVRVTLPRIRGSSASAIGTGVVVDTRGTILTCLHVVEGATGIQVVFSDGTESEASVIVAQPENDLAVLRPKLVPDDLVPATLGSSNMLRVGDGVVAVGNPFGMSDSLTAGVVSGLDRNLKFPRSGRTLTGLIQFDAAVNPGNSGGPLLDRNGEVVGIITALLNPTDQEFFIGMGFAIPIETAGAAAGVPPL